MLRLGSLADLENKSVPVPVSRKAFLQSEDFIKLHAACVEDEKGGFFKYSDCLEKPLADAPLFSKFSEWLLALKKVYEGDFADLVYGDLPPMAEIERTIGLLKGSFNKAGAVDT